MDTKNVLILLDSEKPLDEPSIIAELKAKGFTLTDHMDQLGILAGSCEEACMEDFKKVPGVLEVREEGEMEAFS